MFGADGQYRTRVVLELLDVIHVPLSNRPGGSSTQGESSTQVSTSAGRSQYQDSQQDLSEEVRLLRVSPSVHFSYLMKF
jgi:hypothetical protein